jgi:alginate production protein
MIKTPLSGLIAIALLALPGTTCAQAAPEPAAPREGRRIDERRPDKPFTVDLFGRPLQLGGSWEYSDEKRRNFDLNPARARDRRVREHELKLEARTRPGIDTAVFVQAVGDHASRRTQGTPGAQRKKSLARGQTWVKVERIGGTGFAVQAGRVALIERRSWWWDDDLDGIRLLHAGDTFRLDTGLAKELARVSSADRGVLASERGLARWFGQASWRYAPRHALDAFWLVQHDASSRPGPGSAAIDAAATDPSDLRARWLGWRASGEWRAESGLRLAYRADAALLRGREALTAYAEGDDGRFTAGGTASRPVRGHAVDLGATAFLPGALRPSVSLGHARGSGGERSGRLDANFRQTGLQENKARFGGVKRLRQYGELLRPELSNLVVTSLGAGIRLGANSSVELMGLRYRQRVPSTTIPGARLSTAALGTNTDIGREIDLVVAVREWRSFEFTFKWSRFTPGAAFAADRRDPAHGVEIDATFNF